MSAAATQLVGEPPGGEYEVNDLVRYVPGHAHGDDPKHPDCEVGRVTRVDFLLVFVRFRGYTSMPCDRDQIRWVAR